MVKSLYITSLEQESGKAVAAVGLMEQLCGHFKGVSVFRPVITEGSSPDNLIAIMTELYHLPFAAEELYGVTYEVAQALLSAGKYEELHNQILEKFMALESRCDFVLCVGTDYTGVSTALEFDFNVEVARNLGAPLLPIINGRGKDPKALIRSIRALLESLEVRKCNVLAVIVNRIEGNQRGSLLAGLKQDLPAGKPVYVFTEEPILGKTTVREIAAAIGAELLSGDDNWMDGEVNSIKVAAMELRHFLDHLEEGSLVITPGDRSDIILGTLAADRSTRYPRVAGLILTGNLKPAPQIQRLLEGLRVSPVPVFAVETDTFTTALEVSNVRPVLTVATRRKITAAIGMVESSMDMPGLLERDTLALADRITPLMFQYELIRKTKEQRRHIVLPEGSDERVLRAAEIILLRDVCDITLLGDTDEVREKISRLGLSLDRAPIIDPRSSKLLPEFAAAYFELRKHKGISQQMALDTMNDTSYFGTMMVHQGLADGMVSGAIHTTAHTIRPALEFVKTKPGISVVSSVFFMCLADQVLVYGDCAIVPEPTSSQLADIAISSAMTAAVFGIEPRVAMLSYSTGSSGTGPDVDRVREATRIVRERMPALKVEGPIQYDAAVDATVAKIKMPESDVAGHATVFIFPDLSSGNNAYKAVQRAAGAIAIGPVLQGLNKPVNDLSRGALVPDIVNTIAITAIQAHNPKTVS